jgi:hypothetical protein
MQKLTLYRGIAVPLERVEEIRETIRLKGISGHERTFWKFVMNDLRKKIPFLIEKPNLSIKDTRDEKASFSVICACGDKAGATYYAVKHNRHSGIQEVSMVISFYAPLSDVFIDGRDFLYTCFGLWDRQGQNSFERQKEYLSRIFGNAILKYFEKAAMSKDSLYRIAVCDLACQDFNVIRDHAKNTIILGGRYETLFCSAFFAKTPIPFNRIIDVELVKESQVNFKINLSINDFVEGNLV